ncbi:GntR family transcriptional regulator [Nocardioides carbamazepini]|uniref:GntR family transcriptional regulator n=1 Tax=Nocardioides carbamazepini TaxID=2854259 RepID=UPI00214A28FA|nr:GntR family transcriptional regulator [Nocardioides carbamazepini]MCR1784932.1 GntR family transcriptional regulator [Nocardioides carbamazepini]
MSDAELPEPVERRLQRLWAEAAERGGPMPSELALASSLEISRPAVREALVRLEERGFIHRRKGADTAVNSSLLGIPARFEQRLESAELIAAMGRTPSVRLVTAEIGEVTLDEAREHDVSPRRSVLRTTKVWSADDEPVLVARDVVPVLARTDLADLDPAAPMPELARALVGEQVGWELVWPGADGLSEEEAGLTGRAVGEPAMTLDATGISRSGTVCYWTREVHLRGAFRYALVRRADW